MDVIFPEMRYKGMENLPESSLQKRVRSRMDALGLNALNTAKRADLGDSFVRDILRGKTRSPSAENLAKLAEALETTVEYLRGGKEPGASSDLPVKGLEVIGFIQAGYWLDRSIIDPDIEHEIIPVARDPRFPYARQYALQVQGDSMDKEFADGSFVTCVDYASSGLELKVGRIVHVERHNGPLVELTLKELQLKDGAWCLMPKSTNPKHQPLELDGDEGTEIIVKGVVLGDYKRREL